MFSSVDPPDASRRIHAKSEKVASHTAGQMTNSQATRQKHVCHRHTRRLRSKMVREGAERHMRKTTAMTAPDKDDADSVVKKSVCVSQTRPRTRTGTPEERVAASTYIRCLVLLVAKRHHHASDVHHTCAPLHSSRSEDKTADALNC